MKVFISVDIEGVAGVTDPKQGRPGNADYEYARLLMTEEASAAVRGAIAGGASSVVVADSHAFMCNILADLLDPRARLITGAPRGMGMVQGLDPSYDALVLVGFHTAAGTVGVMSHTLNGLAFSRITIEGRTVGEVELCAGYAAEMGVPLTAVTGDDLLAKEVSEIFTEATTVVVKDCIGGWASNSLSPKNSRDLIEREIAASLTDKRTEQVNVPSKNPFVVEVEMTRQFFADACSLVPSVNRLSATKISFECPDYSHLMRVLQAMSYIVMGVQKTS